MPETPTHYKVTVNNAFIAANELFLPGRNYRVKKEVYDGVTSDGKQFKDLCATAEPFVK
jgi:hypothetical protein